MSTLPDTDGLLREWGTRLFYPNPKKARRSEEPRLPRLSAGEIRSRVRSAVSPKSTQVVVRISGGGRGMKAMEAHMRYISRQGKEEAGGKGQTFALENEAGETLQGGQAVRETAADWRDAGEPIPDTSTRREAFNIILSMPEGTPPEVVKDSARDFARETFDGHKYLFVLHTDTNDPHVHLMVRAQRADGRRLNPRKADLQRWRERFAARLQDRGVNATATHAATRGVTRASAELWRVKAGERQRKGRPTERTGAAVQASISEARDAWQKLAGALETSPLAEDRVLAKQVQGFVGRTFKEPRQGRGAQPADDRTTGAAGRGSPEQGDGVR